MKIGMETDRGREKRKTEQQGKEKAEKKKKESVKKGVDYIPPSPVYDPSFKEDALPLFNS